MQKRIELVIAAALLNCAVSLADCETAITIGQGEAGTDGIAEVPVYLSMDEPVTAFNLRLTYDPLLLTAVGVQRSSLLSHAHLVRYAAPADGSGQLNIVVFSATGADGLLSHSGTALRLLFRVKPGAVTGSSTDIAFNTTGATTVPASDLSDATGRSVPHSRVGGRVTFTTPARHWMLYE